MTEFLSGICFGFALGVVAALVFEVLVLSRLEHRKRPQPGDVIHLSRWRQR